MFVARRAAFSTSSSLSDIQVARAGRFGTKGLAITFVSEEQDAAVLNDVQARFEVSITELPAQIDKTSYSLSRARICHCSR